VTRELLEFLSKDSDHSEEAAASRMSLHTAVIRLI